MLLEAVRGSQSKELIIINGPARTSKIFINLGGNIKLYPEETELYYEIQVFVDIR